MKTSFRNILINSTLAFVSAFIITTIIHESGHYLSYLFFGANPTLFHNYVQSSGDSIFTEVKIISALAGPLFSLFQGILFGLIVSNVKKNTAEHLFYLWISLLGFVNFFGYLVMTPLSTVGDTGRVAQLLDIAFSIQIIIAIVGFAVLIWLIRVIAKNFAGFIPAQAERKMRAKYIYMIMFFPIMIGSVVNMLLAFPVVAILSAIYPLTSSYAIMSSFGVILKSPNTAESTPEFEEKILKSLVGLFVVAVIINRLLTFGVG